MTGSTTPNDGSAKLDRAVGVEFVCSNA